MGTETQQKSLLGGISATQVIAGAMAAATSFALSNTIGIAGSVIGAAVGSIAATVTSQIYKNAINRSIEGIAAIDESAENRIAESAAHTVGKNRASFPVVRVAAAALCAGLLAVGIYAASVNLATNGEGIGIQAPVIEYVTVPTPAEAQEPAEKTVKETSQDTPVEDETAAETEADAASTDAESAEETVVPETPAETPSEQAPAEDAAESPAETGEQA